MAKQVKLKVEPRTETGRSAARRLKARGIVPAVVYGGKEKSQPLQVSARDINAMLSHASGENILVELEIAGQKATRPALLQEVQHSPVGGDVLHVDFHAISMDEKIQADVPLEALGVATGVKNFGGLLDQNLRLLPIECLPGDLPDRITVDVSALNIGDAIHVRDIKLPPGVTAKVQLDLTAFSVMAPVIEEEPVAAEAEAAAAAGPEVITAKKEEGEEGAPAAGAKGAAGAGAKGAGAPAGKGGGPAPKEKEQKK
jgi:large subunit ribosomal protein L25